MKTQFFKNIFKQESYPDNQLEIIICRIEIKNHAIWIFKRIDITQPKMRCYTELIGKVHKCCDIISNNIGRYTFIFILYGHALNPLWKIIANIFLVKTFLN